MAFVHVITTLLFALALARIDHSECQMLKGKVSCNDCAQDYDFSGLSQISSNFLIYLILDYINVYFILTNSIS